MCPNCVTPWKCNGPHIPEDPLDPARGCVNGVILGCLAWSGILLTIIFFLMLFALILEGEPHVPPQ
jgi:hypothetical protein